MKQNGTQSASETRKCPGCHDMPVLYALSCQPRWHNTQTWVLCQQEYLLSWHELGSCHRPWGWATLSWPAMARSFWRRASTSSSEQVDSRCCGTQRAPRACSLVGCLKNRRAIKKKRRAFFTLWPLAKTACLVVILGHNDSLQSQCCPF